MASNERHVKNKHEQILYRKDIKKEQIRIDAQHVYIPSRQW